MTAHTQITIEDFNNSFTSTTGYRAEKLELIENTMPNEFAAMYLVTMIDEDNVFSEHEKYQTMYVHYSPTTGELCMAI